MESKRLALESGTHFDLGRILSCVRPEADDIVKYVALVCPRPVGLCVRPLLGVS